MSAYYASFPKAVIAYPTTNLSYMIVSYYGNTAATSGTITSTNQTSGTYTSPDLSFNTLYYFTLTPYNASGAGVAKTLNVDTTPKVSGVKATYSTTANAVLQWSGTYKYVKLSRADGVGSGGTVGAYTDISSVVLSQPYIDKDLSGNRTYKCYIPPYDSGGNAAAPSNAISFYTNARAATDLSAVFYDSSSIQISFTMPNNSYSSSYYYLLRASESGVNTDISGTTSPLFVKGLSGGTTYSCYILSYLDNALGATSSSYRVTTTSAGIFYTGITAIPIYTSAGTVSTFSSDTKTVSGATGSYAYANGSYVCLASSGGEGTYCYMGANGSTSSYCCYGTQGSSYGSNYSQDPYVGTYQGGGSGRYWTTTVSSVSYAGEWIQYKLPYKLKLTSYGIMNRNNSGTNRFPYTFYLAGSNNGSTWELVDSRSNQTVSDYGLYTYTVSSTSYYYYFRLIFNVQNSGVNVVNINQFNLYGTALV